MDIKNLVVADLISIMTIESTANTYLESSIMLSAGICRKEKGGYRDLKTNHFYSEEQKLGLDRIEEGTVVPFSKYYHPFGIRKLHGPENRKEVHQKVKNLRREGKL